MTEKERNDKFDEIKRRVTTLLSGKEPLSADVAAEADVELRVTDKHWDDGESWMSRVRMTTPMNNGIEDMNRYDPNATGSRTMTEPDWLAGVKLAK